MQVHALAERRVHRGVLKGALPVRVAPEEQALARKSAMMATRSSRVRGVRMPRT